MATLKAADKAYRVLIVDDDPVFLKLLEKHLVDSGHVVLSATNGFEAMRVLLEEGPEIIITDWMMPGMDGLELCRAIREQEGIGFVYVIILTSQPDTAHMVRAFEEGADDYLRKPFDKQELFARLRAGKRLIKLQADLDRQNREVHLSNAKMALASRELENANRKLRILATTDELTGLLNRREAMNRLNEAWASSQRRGEPLSCINLDIDHFKSFNDTYGHAIGDLVLRDTSAALKNNARQDEPVCRVGGEEFLIICPHADILAAAAGAERVRRAVEERIITSGDLKLNVTISLGVATREESMITPDDLLRKADDALYQAKHEGRNRVAVLAPDGAEVNAADASANGSATAGKANETKEATPATSNADSAIREKLAQSASQVNGASSDNGAVGKPADLSKSTAQSVGVGSH